MLILIINSDEYRLHSDFKRQNDLKFELLSKYPEDADVRILRKGKEIDRCKLADLFMR